MNPIHFARAILLLLGFVFAATFLNTPAHAFDCAEASTLAEKSICKHANLKAQDDAMSRTYFDLRKRMSTSAKLQLKNVQKQWLIFRADSCESNSDCLLEETKLWAITLSTIEPGMVPVLIWQKGGENNYRIRVEGVKFATPDSAAKKLFNTQFDHQLKDTPFSEVIEEGMGMAEQEVNFELQRLNDRLLSVTVNTIDYLGAHPSYWQDAINIDMKTGVLLDSSKLFPTAAIDELTNECRDQIIAVKYEESPGTLEEKRLLIEQEYPNSVRQHILTMDEWNFNDEGVEIVFDKYDIGPYVEVPYECIFSDEKISVLSNTPELFVK